MRRSLLPEPFPFRILSDDPQEQSRLDAIRATMETRIEEFIQRSQPNQAEVLRLLEQDALLTGTMMYQQNPDGTLIRIPPPQARE